MLNCSIELKKMKAKLVASGGYAKVYFGKIGKYGNVAIKLQRVKDLKTLNMDEEDIMIEFGRKKPQIVPQLYKIFYCNDYNPKTRKAIPMKMLIMEKMDGDLTKLFFKTGKINPKQVNDMIRVLDRFHGYGYIHFDAKVPNFFYKGSPNSSRVKVFIGDFGFSSKVDDNQFQRDPEYRRETYNFFIQDFNYLYEDLLRYAKKLDDAQQSNKNTKAVVSTFLPKWKKLKRFYTSIKDKDRAPMYDDLDALFASI